MTHAKDNKSIVRNMLFIGAHPDDLEVMAGGTVKRIIEHGGQVHALTMTNGAWTGPDGVEFRCGGVAIKEAAKAAEIIGYSLEHLNEKIFDIQYKDSIVMTILDRIDRINADTIICPWIDDVHIDHQIVAKMALGASRRVPRVLMAQANSYVGTNVFNPNIFFDISGTFHSKMMALECYESEIKRTGEKWKTYHDVLTKYYGLISGVERAEGFISHKFCI